MTGYSFLFFRWLQAQIPHDHLEILPGFAFLPRVSEKKRRVIRHGEFGSLPVWIADAFTCWREVVEASAKLGHGRVDGQQILCRNRAERHDYPWLDHPNLTHQKWRAGIALVALWGAITRRAALHNIRDVDIL